MACQVLKCKVGKLGRSNYLNYSSKNGWTQPLWKQIGCEWGAIGALCASINGCFGLVQILRLFKNLTNVKHCHLMTLEIKKQKGGLKVGVSNENSLTKNVNYTNDQNNMIGT